MKTTHPDAIPSWAQANFQVLLNAARSNDLALLSCKSKLMGEPVYTICAVSRLDGEIAFSPIGRLFNGNPYEELDPPKEDF